MKSIVHFGLALTGAGLCACQEIQEKNYELKARIVDETGSPVDSATVVGARMELLPNSPIPTTKNVRVEALSDSKGLALLRFRSIPTPGGVAIHKDGYYSSFYRVSWNSGPKEGSADLDGTKAGQEPDPDVRLEGSADSHP